MSGRRNIAISRRPARWPTGAAPAAAALPTPIDIFGANLKHEWDLALSTITVATGVSSISDLRGAKNLTQATGGAQPAYTAAGLQSYMTGDGVNDVVTNAAMALSGDITFLCVASFLVDAAASHNLYQLAPGNQMLLYLENGFGFRGCFTDLGGFEQMLSAGGFSSAIRAHAVRNAVGSSRKYYNNGGAGTAGASTLAMNAGSTISLVGGAAGTNFCNARAYWAGVVQPSPALANLNAWGAWGAARFGLTWSPAT